jgi:pyruvate/2-oxoglutarate dehydrogenase complex dihydrolipoamide dehydrogenase (E3) component
MATPGKPARYDRNLIVIGAGAAGLVTAYIAAATRAKVTLVEADRMGGECLNTGCVPSKALIRSARLAQQIRQAADFGLGATGPVVHWRRVMQRVQDVVQAIAPHDSVARYTALGVEVLQGQARLLDPWTVEVRLPDGGTQRLTTRSIVLATGARPVVPAIAGIDAMEALTSETLWTALAALDAPPPRLLLLGGGPMGCELAQALQYLGSQVTLLEHGPRLLPREDEDVAAFARQTLEHAGVRVLTDRRALRFERAGTTRRLWLAPDAAAAGDPIEFDTLLCATGRQPRLQNLGLETLGIDTGAPLDVNAFLQTRWPHIYVAGDVASSIPSTPVAAHQAWYAAVNALFGTLRRFKVDYSVVPQAIYLDPEIARVGLTEQQALQQGVACELTRFELGALDRAVTDGATAGYVKVLTVPGKDRILGATVVGEHAAELLPQFTLALRHGLGLNALLRTLHAYPTLGEVSRQLAGQWRRNHMPQWIYPWLARYHAWRRG